MNWALLPLTVAIGVVLVSLIPELRRFLHERAERRPILPDPVPVWTMTTPIPPESGPDGDDEGESRVTQLPIYPNPVDPMDGVLPQVNMDWEVPHVDYNAGAEDPLGSDGV